MEGAMTARTITEDDKAHTRLVGKRKHYKRPDVQEYGSVRDLTAAGGTSGNEGQGRSRATGSDRSIKENIIQIGTHPMGIGLYLFDYKPEFRDACGHDRQFGVMADEVETVMPEAVSRHAGGYKMVDYGLLGIARTRH